MKKLLIIQFLLMALMSCVEQPEDNSTRWFLLHRYDDFHERTDEKYITASGEGTFSNSATLNDYLFSTIDIDSDWIAIHLYKYGRVMADTKNKKVTLKIKGDDGTVVEDNTLYHFFDSKYNKEKTDSIFNILLKGGNIKFHIKMEDNYSKFVDIYDFEFINSSGLPSLIDSIR